MQKTFPIRSGPRGGYVTVGTLILAAVSAVMLVLMSGCHSTPANNAFAATKADKAVEARLQQAEPFVPLQPFDEHFVEVDATE